MRRVDNNTDIVVVDSPETDMTALNIADTFGGTIIHIVEGDTLPSDMPPGHFPTTRADFLQTLNDIVEAIRTPEESPKE